MFKNLFSIKNYSYSFTKQTERKTKFIKIKNEYKL